MSPSPSAVPATPHPVRVGRELPIALLLSLALAGLYGATLQERQFGDGSPITRNFLDTLGTGGLWTHVLYFPVARWLLEWVRPDNPVRALELVSVLGGALGGGGAFLVARGFGATRAVALAATLALTLSPAWWFFSTTVEVHGLHVACVALCAALTLFAPWQRPVLAAALAGLALPLVFLSHKSGLFLGPGCVALAQVGRWRRGLPPLSWRVLLLGVGPFFLACFALAVWITARMQYTEISQVVSSNADFVSRYSAASPDAVFLDLWLWPLGVLGPLALSALLSKRTSGWPAAAVVLWSVPSLIFFSAWGYSERGAYALPTALAWAAVAACAFPATSPSRRWAWAGLVVAQAAWGGLELRRWDAPEWGRDNRARAAAVERALGARGSLFSINVRFQEIEAYLPGVREHNVFPVLLEAVQAGVPPHEFAEGIAAQVRLAHGRGPVAFDLSAQVLLEARPEERYVQALRERVEAEFSLYLQDDPRWPMAVTSAEPAD